MNPAYNLRQSRLSAALRDSLGSGVHQLLGESPWHKLYLSILCLMGIVGFIVSPYHSKSRLALYLLGLVVYGVTVAWVRTPRRFWQALTLAAVFCLLLTLIGAAGTTWQTQKLPVLLEIAPALPRLPGSVLSRLGAANGFHPNEIAGMLALYVPPLLGILLFWRKQDREPARALWWLSLAALGVAGLYLLLSAARGGLGALAAAAALLLWLRKRAWGLAALAAAGAAVVVVLLALPHNTLQAAGAGLMATFDGPGVTRTEIWQQAADAIRGAPLTGIGLYNFVAVFRYKVYLPPDSTFVVVHAHNQFLQTALDLGLPGALVYTLLLADIGWHAYTAGRGRAIQRCDAAAGACFGLAAALVAFGIFGLVDSIPVTSRVAWLVWFIIGLGAAARRVWAHAD